MELLWRVTRSRVRSPNRIALEIVPNRITLEIAL